MEAVFYLSRSSSASWDFQEAFLTGFSMRDLHYSR
jgi:hypothetical protein